MMMRTKAELEKLRDDATPPPWFYAGTNADTDEVRLEHGGFPEKGYSHWSYMRAEDARLVEAAPDILRQLIGLKEFVAQLAHDMQHQGEHPTKEEEKHYQSLLDAAK